MVWSDTSNDTVDTLLKCWFVIVRIATVFCITKLIASICAIPIHKVDSLIVVSAHIILFTILSQLLAICPVIYTVRKRLNENYTSTKSFSAETNQINQSMRVTWAFFLFTLVMGIAYGIFWTVYVPTDSIFLRGATRSLQGTEVIVQSILSSGMLSIALLFILVDIRVAKCLVLELQLCAESYTLTLRQYHDVRAEIKRRVAYSSISNAAAIICGIFNVIAIFAILYIDAPTMYVSIEVFIKELIFLTIVFWEASMVNEAADKLTRYLADDITDGKDTASDITRLKIFATAITRPISFSFVGYRYKLKDLMLQGVSVTITLFVFMLKLFVRVYHDS